MSHLLLVGSWKHLGTVACRLHAAGHAVLLVRDAEAALERIAGMRVHLTIAVVETLAVLASVTELVRRAGGPWLALDGGALITEAFKSGAVSVLPVEAEPDLVERATLSLLAQLGLEEATKAPSPAPARSRRIRPGDPLLWSPGQVLVVVEGVLARMALHEDGTEVLLGFVGPGGLVITPREDLSASALFACTEVEVTALSWEEAVKLPRFPERLRDQLIELQEWSAAQARPHLDDRLTGILELLARQFGRPHAKGQMIDFRMTHAQLAQAIGATRSTVTRLLARLRHSGRLMVTGRERWIVRGDRSTADRHESL